MGDGEEEWLWLFGPFRGIDLIEEDDGETFGWGGVRWGVLERTSEVQIRKQEDAPVM